MANEILGHIDCDGCGGQAGVKKLNNSDLLYLHCKKCGMDRRSGKALQDKWRSAIGAPELPVMAGDEKPDEWKPNHQTHSKPSPGNSEFIPASETENPEETGKSNFKEVATNAAVFVAILGMFIKAVRG